MENCHVSTPHTPESEKDGEVIKETEVVSNLLPKVKFKSPSTLPSLSNELDNELSDKEEEQSHGEFQGSPTHSDEIRILTVTFNIGNAPLNPAEVSHWLPLSDGTSLAAGVASDVPTSNCAGPELIVIGLQESFNRRAPHHEKQRRPIPEVADSSSQQQLMGCDHMEVVICPGDEDNDEDQDEDAEFPCQKCEKLDSMQRLGLAIDRAAAGLDIISKPKKIIETSLKAGSDLITGDKKTKERLKDTIRSHLGDKYAVLAACNRFQMKLQVYIRKDRMSEVALNSIKVGAENTGIAGVAPNKGGLAVKFSIGGSSLAFISCHLQAHSGAANCIRRIDSVANILSGIRMGSGNLKRVDIDAQAHHTFLMGDLNFRVDPKHLELPVDNSFGQHRQHVLELIKEGRLSDVNKGDELAHELEDEKLLVGFNTVEPCFPPTFKMKRGAIHEYDLRKRSKYLLLLLPTCLLFKLGSLCLNNKWPYFST